MTVELTPLGVACNLSCPYCYQNPMRDAGNIGNHAPPDFDKMFAALADEGQQFTVFGGEALLLPLPDLERIWAWGFERWKSNGLQTNGVLITAGHIAAFQRYAVHVGFSLDGPDALNDSRWAGSEDKTRAATKRSHDNLRTCVAAGVQTSVIVTLYRGNALPDVRPRLLQWIRELHELGVRGIRVHLLEVDHPIVAERMLLSEAETIAALRDLAVLAREIPTLQLDLFADVRNLLLATDDAVTCVWNACDPYTTNAVRGVDGQGNRSNCGRVNKDGVARLKADRPGFERQLGLYHTPYEHGGCKGCRFFLMCKGQCPGTAIDGDWRNRTRDCRVWLSVFGVVEQELLEAGELPLSLSPERLRLEELMLGWWADGQNVSLRAARQYLRSGASGAPASGGHGDVSHGDSPHGDSHGDHTDAAMGRPA